MDYNRMLAKIEADRSSVKVIALRGTEEADLDFIQAAEHDKENKSFIIPWTREQHASAITSDDILHFIIERVYDSIPVGYVILAGIANPNQSIELRRIVITLKDKGYGKRALNLLKQRVFEDLNAHRLWLDVKEHNLRARCLYEAAGFSLEGKLRDCLKTDEGFESLIVMSLLRDEYAGQIEV